MPSPEQESKPVAPLDGTQVVASPWDMTSFTAALGNPPETRLNQLHGRGSRFRVGNPPELELELFPDAGVVHLEGRDFSLTLATTEAPKFAPSGVVFDARGDSGNQRLSISRTGTAVLIFEPSAAPKSPETPQELQNDIEQPVGLMLPPPATSGDLVAREETSGMPSPTPESPARNEQQPRVQLSGRLGTDPRFRETKNGKVIGSFPLAIHQEDGSVRWQDVKIFNDRAKKLRDQETLKKGMFVEVTGYEHERETKGRDGQVRITKEVYGVVVKPR